MSLKNPVTTPRIVPGTVRLVAQHLNHYATPSPIVSYGSLTLREEPRLRVFENRVLRRVFGSKRDEVTGSGENYIMRSLMVDGYCCCVVDTLFLFLFCSYCM